MERYDSIVEQAKLRQKENVDSRLNMWKSILKPFSFDERDIRKQMVYINYNLIDKKNKLIKNI